MTNRVICEVCSKKKTHCVQRVSRATISSSNVPIQEFEEKLRFYFMKHLTAKCSSRVVTFEIQPSVADHLQHYKLNFHQYKECLPLLKDVNLQTKRYFSPTNYTELIGARFKLRRNKLTYLEGAALEKKCLTGPVLFCLKLYVNEKVSQ